MGGVVFGPASCRSHMDLTCEVPVLQPAAFDPPDGRYGPLGIGDSAMIPPELELVAVPAQVDPVYVMEAPVYPALEQREEGLGRVAVGIASGVLASGVLDRLVPTLELLADDLVGAPLVGHKSGPLHVDVGLHGGLELPVAEFLRGEGPDAPVPLKEGEHGSLAGAAPGASHLPLTGKAGFAAHVGLIGFDRALEEPALRIVGESVSDPVGHVPRGAVGAEFELPLELERGDPLLRGAHEADRHEPLRQGNVRVLEDGAHRDRELIARSLRVLPALLAPVESGTDPLGLSLDGGHVLALAPGANRPFRPAEGLDGLPGVLVRHLGNGGETEGF